MVELLDVEESEVQELCFEHGWTDGLPVVPPTPDRVAGMLAAAGLDADDVLGTVAQRGRGVTALDAAIAAVMAGCRPEYAPVVATAFRAALDPSFNLHAVLTSTGGAAMCVLVSGALATQLEMASQHNALGTGNRANATIGRALRLAAINVLGARTGGMDGSSLGNPGKFTLCFAEDPPPAPWRPLHVELGYGEADTTVTLLATEAPRQIANQLNGDPEGILRTITAAMRSPATFSVGKGGQAIVVLGPEHAGAVIGDGWSRRDVAEFLATHSRISPAELEAAGVLIERGAQHDMTPDPDGLLPAVPGADDVTVVTAGGAGAGWSAYLPAWAPVLHSRSVTRRVAVPGEELPDCGPDGCTVPALITEQHR